MKHCVVLTTELKLLCTAVEQLAAVYGIVVTRMLAECSAVKALAWQVVGSVVRAIRWHL